MPYTIILIQPFVLGKSIDGLLKNDYNPLIVYATLHILHLFLGTWRRIYDTKTFSAIFTDTAILLAAKLKDKGFDKSIIVARVGLSKEMINFFENDLKALFDFLYAVIGSLVVLSFYDIHLLYYCLLLFLPEIFINYFYFQNVSTLNKELNDQTEKEVAVIESGNYESIKTHFNLLTSWRIRLSNSGAINFALIELFVLGLIVSSLIRYCSVGNNSIGEILAVFQYVMRFITGMDKVPSLLQKVTRLKDIQRRVSDTFAS